MFSFLVLPESLIELVGMSKNPKVIDITKKVGTVDTLTEAKISCNLDEKVADFFFYIASYFITWTSFSVKKLQLVFHFGNARTKIQNVLRLG